MNSVPSIDADGYIVVDERQYELLMPMYGHPYCRDAEKNFLVECQDGPFDGDLESVDLIFHLRERFTGLYHSFTIAAQIYIKSVGVKSAVVLDPPEFAGVLCAESGNGHAVVFRMFNSENIDPLRRDLLSAYKNNFPVHVNICSVYAATCIYVGPHISDGQILTMREVAVLLDEGVLIEEDVVASPASWPRIPSDSVDGFCDAPLDNEEFSQVSRSISASKTTSQPPRSE